jgi:hypothetical protein
LSLGIVLGSYNMPHMIELQIACIRYNCGPVPILISDDCSDGLQPTPDPKSHIGRILNLASRSRGVYVWPNAERIGHAGGDMATFWKGIAWGGALGLDVVFKLSQRYVIDIPNWAVDGANRLWESGLSTLGRACAFHRFPIRTEAVGLRVDRWNRPDILAHLTPRRINYAFEQVLFDDIRDRLEGKLCDWPLMSDARPHAAPGVLFRESNSQDDYIRLAAKYGFKWKSVDTRDSNQMEDYRIG